MVRCGDEALLPGAGVEVLGVDHRRYWGLASGMYENCTYVEYWMKVRLCRWDDRG